MLCSLFDFPDCSFSQRWFQLFASPVTTKSSINGNLICQFQLFTSPILASLTPVEASRLPMAANQSSMIHHSVVVEPLPHSPVATKKTINSIFYHAGCSPPGTAISAAAPRFGTIASLPPVAAKQRAGCSAVDPWFQHPSTPVAAGCNFTESQKWRVVAGTVAAWVLPLQLPVVARKKERDRRARPWRLAAG